MFFKRGVLLLASQRVGYAMMRYETITGQINCNIHLLIKIAE